MSKPRTILIAGLAFVTVAAILSFSVDRASIGDSLPTAKPEPSRPQRSASGTSQLVTPVMPPPVLPDILIDPLEPPSAKLRRLGQNPDPFEAQMQAVRSGDPLLIALSLHMTLHCWDAAVQLHGKDVRATLTQNSRDPKTGRTVPPDEMLIRFTEAQTKFGVQRVYPPEPIRAVIAAKQLADWVPQENPDYAALEALWAQMAAPMTPTQRASYDARVAQAAAECRGRMFGSKFGAALRAALDRLVAQNVVSAQLFNRRSGWSSEGVGSLSERDYELIKRAFDEWQPDGIARLLAGGSSAIGTLNAAGLPENAIGATMMLDFSLGTLAACQLQVQDCSPDSSRFRSLCHSMGGCDQSDMASLLRYVFERDGLDATVIDREVNRVVTAYRNRDLDALGIRRAKEKK